PGPDRGMVHGALCASVDWVVAAPPVRASVFGARSPHLRDDRPELGQVLTGDFGGPQHGVSFVDVRAKIPMTVPNRNAGGERKINGDLPERYEGHPKHGPQYVL